MPNTGLLVRAARPVPRAQPLRGRRRRLRRRRRQLHPLIITRAPWSSSSCTRSLRCSSRSFSFSRCTPTWAMRGGSGCAASAWGAPPLGDHGCVAWVGVAKARNLGLPDPLSRSLVLLSCLRINITAGVRDFRPPLFVSPNWAPKLRFCGSAGASCSLRRRTAFTRAPLPRFASHQRA